MLDIVPTREMFAHVSKEMATSAWHWFFLIQPYDLPERLIGASAEYYLRSRMARSRNAAEVFPPEVMQEYIRCFCTTEAIHASCEDYRAAATVDLVDDEASFGTRITAPLLALWSAGGNAGIGRDVLATWRQYATDVSGRELPCGHFLAEEMPDEVYAALRKFFG